MGFFWKWSMYVMSYFPLYILILLQHLHEIFAIIKGLVIEKHVNELVSTKLVSIISIAFFVILLFWAIFTFIHLKRIKTVKNENIGRYEDAGEGTLNYLATFIVPLISLKLSDVDTLLANLALFIMLGKLYTMGDLLYLNPVFTLFGYHIIRDKDNKDIILSKICISDLEDYGESNLNKLQLATLGSTNIRIVKDVKIGEQK
ncbi:hypothetical protein [Latilactobacillus sakei]|uniref:hypothetical protein n=1 Tax=Latilactobacillus sakei TaxID=1599 RepID=UPI003F5396B1